ncbi:MAG TPA: DAK2 domain-containing protein, partial [Gammaproteobacteria bacterium]|nr:DAK2 domain-containing protein [Gammaproteobacteria bacterium]
ALGQLLSREMGGSSGVLLSILFTTAGNASAEGASLASALSRGAEAVSHYGGAEAGDRTMLDALVPALAVLTGGGGVAQAAAAAREGAERTGNMEQANAGRSAYLRSDSLAGNADPGAVAVALAFESLVS